MPGMSSQRGRACFHRERRYLRTAWHSFRRDRCMGYTSSRLCLISLCLPNVYPHIQAIKLFDLLQYYLLPASNTTAYYSRKWLFVDFAYCFVLSQLRIPRLNYTKAVVLLQIFSLWFLDGLLFGGIRLNVFGGGDVEGRVSTSGFQSTF